MKENITASKSEALPDWQAPSLPTNASLLGQYCILEPLHAENRVNDLWSAFSLDTKNTLWRYLPYGPFANKEAFYQFLQSHQHANAEQYYAVVDKKTDKAIGFLAYLRIKPSAGSIEIGSLCFSPLLQKTRIATEAVYLLMNNCFHLGYRRCEWKCNALNEPSKKAAIRFGFQYEGCFRQAMVVKGHNRDTNWYSIIDKEWTALKKAFSNWLNKSNYNQSGVQLKTLAQFIHKEIKND